jgi:multidrug efflux pump subunit AcrB
MRKLIDLSLKNPRAVTVVMLSIAILGGLSLWRIPIDILPVYNSPAVQILTFYSGTPAESIAHSITNRMERWSGGATGMRRQESRSILGASIVTNYFRSDTDPNGALTQVNSLALATIPNLPPGTLPPVVLPFDPTATVPACLVTVDSKSQGEAILYDTARYEVRNMIMSSPGANAPVVFGGKLRAVLALLKPVELEARGLSALDVMKSLEEYNLFLPTGDAKFGILDYAIDSNSMYRLVDRMADIPLRIRAGSTAFLGDVATPKDTHLIQTNVVRVNGRREVYIPVFRQAGASTLRVVDQLKEALPTMVPRLSRPDIHLHLAMDQSVYVRQSIRSLAIEGILGAVLCALVILLFLGEWRMTVIAALLIPLAILAALVGLYLTDQTINVMTLAGLALAIGPLVDIAIVCLENTHRLLHEGKEPRQAAQNGAGEVVMPELVATCSTLLVLAPLALMPGTGQFLFKPMALAVTFAMIAAFVLAMSFVPSRCALWLHKPKDKAKEHPGFIRRGFNHIDAWITAGVKWYGRRLDWVLNHRWSTVLSAAGLLALVVCLLGPQLRREFFPEVDSGAFEMYVRAGTGTRIEVTEDYIAHVEKYVSKTIGADLDVIISEIGVQPDWSAAYTPNSGPMDAVIKVQLTAERGRTSQQYAQLLRAGIPKEPKLATLEVAFNTGGTIRSALNEGKVTPLNVRIDGKNHHTTRAIAERIRDKVQQVDGVVDARIVQRLNYPEFIIDVDRAKSRILGLTQEEIMKNLVAALKSSIQFNKHNFWIDPVSQNQYFVGVQYPEQDIHSLATALNVSITSPTQPQPIPLSNVVHIRSGMMAAEVTHTDLASTIDLTMGVEGRDLGHVADDLFGVLNEFGKPHGKAKWLPYNPASSEQQPLEGTKMILTGEYGHMEDTFVNFGVGMVLAIIFIYFLMVILLDSYLIPLVIIVTVPVGLVGVIPVLYLTGTALNVQSLLGIIFMIGIVVSNTVLLTDFAENLRLEKKLTPTDAIREAAHIRVRPVVMTALATLCALVPMALALERGSEANAPLGRAVLGGLSAGLVTTLFVVPALYALVVRAPELPRQERSSPA